MVGVLLLWGSYIVTSQRCFQIAHCDAARIMTVICCVIVLLSLIPKSFSSFVIGLLRNFEASSHTGVAVGHFINRCVMVEELCERFCILDNCILLGRRVVCFLLSWLGSD